MIRRPKAPLQANTINPTPNPRVFVVVSLGQCLLVRCSPRITLAEGNRFFVFVLDKFVDAGDERIKGCSSYTDTHGIGDIF